MAIWYMRGQAGIWSDFDEQFHCWMPTSQAVVIPSVQSHGDGVYHWQI
jgi:hypothetical protein